jgi:hypothetical protein
MANDASPALGGLARKAADATRYGAEYRRAQMEAQAGGDTLPPYEEWVKQYQTDQAQAEADMKEGFDSVRGKPRKK